MFEETKCKNMDVSSFVLDNPETERIRKVNTNSNDEPIRLDLQINSGIQTQIKLLYGIIIALGIIFSLGVCLLRNEIQNLQNQINLDTQGRTFRIGSDYYQIFYNGSVFLNSQDTFMNKNKATSRFKRSHDYAKSKRDDRVVSLITSKLVSYNAFGAGYVCYCSLCTY